MTPEPDGFPTAQNREFPAIINIEVYRGECPCRCVHCPVGKIPPGQRIQRFGEDQIPLPLYQKIIDEISRHPDSTVRIHSVGEPLLWNDLITATQYTRDHNVRSWIFTSAATHDLKTLQRLCETVDIIEVSLNSTDAQDYQNTKGIPEFPRVVENLTRMREHIQNNSLPTRLIVSRVQTQNRAQDQAFVQTWKGSGLPDDAFVRSFHTYNDLLDSMQGMKQQHQPCLVHWARFNISCQGKAIVCFNELFKKQLDDRLVYGDLNHQTIEQIWKSPQMNAVRQAELTGDYTRLGYADALPCRECTSCQPLQGDNQTSEHQIRQLSTPRRSAGVAILDRDNRALIQLRDNNPNIAQPNRYGLFGGYLEPGETPEQAARREIREEIGITLQTLTPFKVYRYPDGNLDREVHVFLARGDYGEKDIRQTEGAGWTYCAKEDLEKLPFAFKTKQMLTDIFQTVNPHAPV